MASFFEQAALLLDKGEDIVVASIIAAHGSAPRGPGSRMILRRDGSIMGSIGGGRVEGLVIEGGKELFGSGASKIKDYNLDDAKVAETGMICGGDVTVCVRFVAASKQNRETFRNAWAMEGKNSPAWLVTRIDKEEDHRIFIYAPNVHENGDLPPEVARKCGVRSTLAEQDGVRYILERIDGVDKVFIFGGGHVGGALVPVMAGLGFYTAIVDDREEFCNSRVHPLAEEFALGFDEATFRSLPIDERSYVVIVTRGHMADEDVLRYALAYAKAAPYIGMIGSRKKRNTLYDHLLAEGFTYGEVSGVYSPIGLDIGAQTPEEIAVSIAAEIIQVQARKR